MENTEWIDLLEKIFEVCVIPLLTIAAGFVINYLNVKRKQIETEVDDKLLQKYLDMALSTVASCVNKTNQTYVDSLKAQGKFDGEAQKKAFADTLEAVLTILNDDAKDVLSEAVGDLNVYLTTQIEDMVHKVKKPDVTE